MKGEPDILRDCYVIGVLVQIVERKDKVPPQSGLAVGDSISIFRVI